MSGNSPASRWTREHGYGRRRYRLRKIAYATRQQAEDVALLLDLKCGVEFNAYPCRWGDQYRDGEVHPLHWHVGRAPG